jgi:hypothetical protein
MTHFLFRARQLGAHMHVGVWAGNENQANQRSRPKLGELVMDPEQWQDLLEQLGRLEGHGPAIFDLETVEPQA